MLLGMQRTLNLLPVDSPEVESDPTFNILITYEDFETGKYAKETYDFLAQNLGGECELTSQMWKFDVLSIPKLRSIAVHDATQADIILISSHGDPLPDHVLKWAESWITEGTQALALVVLFDRPETQSRSLNSVREYLAEVAKRGHMEFFAQPNFWPGAAQRNSPLYVPSSPVASGRAVSPFTTSVHREIIPRWGINE
jgi:hypothetical protein